MDSVRVVLEKVKLPNSVDDFMKSNTESKVAIVGVASKYTTFLHFLLYCRIFYSS